MLLQRAHRQQQAALRRCQEQAARAKGLEETVRQQEKVSGRGLGGWGARTDGPSPSWLFRATRCQTDGNRGDVRVTATPPRAVPRLGDTGTSLLLPQVIKVMERVLQDRLSMSSEKPAGRWEWDQGGHPPAAASTP